jgi:hypothetical protein
LDGVLEGCCAIVAVTAKPIVISKENSTPIERVFRFFIFITPTSFCSLADWDCKPK